MKLLSQEEINEVRNKSDIVDVIGSYIPLTQKGRNYFAVCPFHDDHNPSMSISPEKQIYTCFVCGKSGNVFNFVKDYEKVTFIEAVKIVADRVGISLHIDSMKKEEQTDDYHKVYDLANKYYQNNLNSKFGIEAKEYLNRRNINDDIVKEFDIGLSINNNGLSKLLSSKDFSLLDIDETGLVRAGTDTYRNRIMFPLYDLDGKVVGFSGRIYNTESDSKYINTNETKYFKKGKLLYNFHRAKEYARTNKNIIVLEGFVDVIRCFTIGVKNVVATMGTAITPEQAKLLKRLSQNIILCFDGDDAGNKATKNCIEELEKIGITPKIVRLPSNYDPDEFICEKGADAFLSYINNPLSKIDYIINEYKKKVNFNDSMDVSDYIRFVTSEVEKLDDEALMKVVLRKLSDETKIELASLEKMVTKKDKVTFTRPVNNIKSDKYSEASNIIIYYMLNSIDILKYISKNMPIFSSKEQRMLVNKLLEYYNKYKVLNLADFISYLGENSDIINLTLQISSKNIKSDISLAEIDDYIKVIDKGLLEKEISTLNDMLLSENDELEKITILQKIAELKKKESA